MTKLLQAMLLLGTFFYISLGNVMGQTFKDLTIGNRYVYVSKNIKIITSPMQNTYSTSSTQIFIEEVTKDSVINGVRYYKITNSLNTQVKWERSDSLGIYLWSTNSHKEYPSYSLTMGVIDIRKFDSSQTASYFGLTKGNIYFGGFDCSQAKDFCSFFYIGSFAVRKSSTNVDMGMTFIESVKSNTPNYRTITYQSPIGILSVSDTWVVTDYYSPRPGVPSIRYTRIDESQSYTLIAGRIKNKAFQLLPSGEFAFDSVQSSNVATPVASQKMVLQSLTMTPLAATIVSIKPDTLSTAGEIMIDQKTDGYTKLEIVRLSGQSVLLIAAQQNKAGQYKIPVNVSSLTTGTYSCRLQSTTGTDFREIIVQK